MNKIQADMSGAFPAAEVEQDGNGNVALFCQNGTNFVHIVVDFTCYDETHDTVAIHARPEHVFRAAAATDLFEGCDTSDGHEYPDGLGNCMWMLAYPRDAQRIQAMAVKLAQIAAVDPW